VGFLEKLFGGRGIPAWASSLAPQEYEAFAAQLSAALRSRSLPADVRSGRVTAVVDGEKVSLGFDDLARKCRGIESAAWPSLIAEHLDVALQSDQADLDALGKDLVKARTLMKVQLMRDSALRKDWVEGLNYRTLGAGVKAVLVYDLPQTVTSVPANHLRGWEKFYADLFDEAADHVRAEGETLVPESIDLPDARVILHQLIGDSFFVCSHALWLERYPDAQSERGVLLAVPSRHTVIFHAIRDASVWRALSVLPSFVHDLHARLPGAVSPNLFWIRNGQVVDIPTAVTASGMQVMPPASLVGVLGDLRET
jgi:hypothetical protein